MRGVLLVVCGLALLAACERAEVLEEEKLPGVSDLAVQDLATGNTMALSWTNPPRPDATGVFILRFHGECLTDPGAASEARVLLRFAGADRGQEWIDRPDPDDAAYVLLPDEADICYAVFVKYGTDYAAAVTVSGRSTDAQAPAGVTGLEATAGEVGDRAIHLAWSNPADEDLERIRILRRAGRAPAGYDDPDATELVVSAPGTSLRDEGVQDNLVYHYAVWTLDEKDNHGDPQPAGPVTRLEDDDLDGFDEAGGDCDDTNQHAYPGSGLTDCSGVDLDCDGVSWDPAYCTAWVPVTDPQCASDQITCQEGAGCTWWNVNGVSCDDGDPGTDGDMCVAGACVAGCRQNDAGFRACQPAGTRGAALVVVPAGHFWMGCNQVAEDCTGDWREYETPLHRVFLDTYGIDETEVTQEHYEACVDDGACVAPSMQTNCYWKQKPAFPVTCIDWYQASAYCNWAGKRLCTEAEWEKAARGLDGRHYPWGDAPPDCEEELAVFDQTGSCMNPSDPRPEFCGCGAGSQWYVGSMPAGASPYGVLDMAGNVWEWVHDWRDVNYYHVSPERNPEGPASGPSKVGRGGGFADTGQHIRSTLRGALEEDTSGIDVGFRCCKSLPAR